MTQQLIENSEISKPRFEFRSFGQQFDDAHYRMSRLSVPMPSDMWERHSDEIYIMSCTNDVNNTKIRDGNIDIKTYIQTVDGLEQWNPLMRGEFPLKVDVLAEEVFTAFKVEIPSLVQKEYSLEDFIRLISIHPDLQRVRVHKQRFGYRVNNTICEYGIVLINGARVATINTESTEIDDINKTIGDLGLVGVENINYLQAIKRVIGMIDKPLANI